MKRSVSIALAALASITIWIISNLSEETSDIVSVQVVAHSNIVGHSNVSGESVTIAAVVSGSGFSLLRLSLNRNSIVDVTFDSEDLVNREGDFYTISDNSLFKYASQIMGPSVSVKSFLSHYVTFRFLTENYKKVPVVPVSMVSCRDQYMPYGDLNISQDSVIVYGSPVRLESLDKVMTRQIVHRDVWRSIHGVVELECPAGMRLSQNQITYSQEITRYVEYTTTSSVWVKNLPKDRNLTIFPEAVHVTYRFVFPVSGTPAQSVSFYVDYNEFINSLTGKCMIHAENLPDVAIDWQCSPQMCDCVETVVEQGI